MAEFVTLDISDGIATIRLNRPPVNALSLQTLREIADVAAIASADPDVAALLLYGGEKVFAAGDELDEIAELDAERAAALAADRQAALDRLAAVGVPTVAAISGYALGGGLELALGADRRVAGDNIKLGLPQTRAGLLPGGGPTARLTALVGPSKAKDLLFTGRFVSAADALAMGLIDEVVAPDEVYSAALRWARQFVGGRADVLAAAKAAVDAAADPAPDRGEQPFWLGRG